MVDVLNDTRLQFPGVGYDMLIGADAMDWYFLYSFIYGLLFGSFFLVVGFRLPLRKPFLWERSACCHCHTPLKFYELLPVLSYVIQRGRSRCCKTHISVLYPFMELLTGSLYAFCYINIGIKWELLGALLLVSLLMIVLVSDLKFMVIPNQLLLFFLPFIILVDNIMLKKPFMDSFIGAAAGFGVIGMMILISNGRMGAGDMKLFGLLGWMLGMKLVLMTLFLACTFGAVIGGLLLLTRRIDRRQPVPFVPYIAIATIISYFYGNPLYMWYASFY